MRQAGETLKELVRTTTRAVSGLAAADKWLMALVCNPCVW